MANLLQQHSNCFTFQTYKENTSVYYHCYNHSLGAMVLFTTKEGICGLHFLVEPLNNHLAIAEKKLRSPLYSNKHVTTYWWTQLIGKEKNIPLLLAGTLFQKKVWKTLCTIPIGSTTTYQAIATQLTIPQSTRAVANSIAKNNIAWLIPCHRVIRKDRKLGGYRWGESIKKRLLAYEQRLRIV